MSITVNLMSTKRGELKRFLDFYYKTTQTDDDVMEWIYVYNSPKDAVRIINVFMEKSENFNISLWVQVGDDDIVAVGKSNKKSIIEKIHSV